MIRVIYNECDIAVCIHLLYQKRSVVVVVVVLVEDQLSPVFYCFYQIISM
jgi:hypothetical protein